MGESHLVVDGSNIATEGRSLPSLEQLLDAVEAVSKEFSYDNVTVIVDATFGHRIDASERQAYEDKINNGEIITPPAGVIGRGDAFILEVADRADAVVLSNDSFQEFHGTYDWLFEEGRLVGGKHVPGVGWIFLARSPVRGPTSRRAVSDAKRKRRGSKKTAKAKPSSKRPSSKSSSRSSKKSSSKKSSASSSDNDKKDTGRKRGGKEPEPYNEPLPFIEFVGAHPVGSVIQAEVEQFSSHGAYVVCDGTRCYISLKSISDPPPRSAREVLTIGETRDFVVQAVDTPRRGIDLAMPGMESIDTEDLPDETEETPEPEPAATKGRTRRRAPEREPEPAAEPEPEPEPAAEAEPVDEKKLSVSQRRKLRARQQAEAAAAEEAEAAPAKKAAAKKTSTRKASTRKKAPARKTSTRKKAATKKAAAPKKTATRKTTAAKKTAAKKTAAKKTSTRKTSTRKRAAARKTATRTSSTTKKAATKKSTARKSTARKATAKTSTARKKAAPKKTPATKKAAKKRTTRKSTPRKRSGSDGDAG